MAFVVKRTLVVAVLLGALGILVGWYTYNSTFREARERLTSEATLLAEHSARSLEGIDLTLQELVRVIEAEWQSGNPPSAAYHQALRKRVGALSQVIPCSAPGPAFSAHFVRENLLREIEIFRGLS